jgi:prophage DNA circulation protein
MSWNYDLQRACFRGVKFDVKRISDNCKRRWARQTYPYVDGDDIEDMGREPVETTITAVFVGPDYLEGLSDLLQVVKDGKSGPFNHPLLGTKTARLSIDRIEHEDTARDMCVVDITVIEDGAGGDVEKLQTTYALQVEMETIIIEVELELDEISEALDAIGDAVDTVTDAVAGARAFIEDVTSTVTKAVNGLNRFVKKCKKAITAVQKLGDVNSYGVVKALRRLGHSAQKLGERVLGNKWPLRQQTMSMSMPACLLAHTLYGDASRADELCELNSGSIRNPLMLPAGFVLKAFST